MNIYSKSVTFSRQCDTTTKGSTTVLLATIYKQIVQQLIHKWTLLIWILEGLNTTEERICFKLSPVVFDSSRVYELS